MGGYVKVEADEGAEARLKPIQPCPRDAASSTRPALQQSTSYSRRPPSGQRQQEFDMQAIVLDENYDDGEDMDMGHYGS
jgi:hypothetical protein